MDVGLFTLYVNAGMSPCSASVCSCAHTEHQNTHSTGKMRTCLGREDILAGPYINRVFEG